MPRPLVFGNGTLFAGFDSRFRMRDLYFPFPGSPNHLAGYLIRFGVWVDGHFSWIGDDEWSIQMRYQDGTDIGVVLIDWPSMSLSAEARIGLDPLEPTLAMEWTVSNHANHERSVRLFVAEDLRINESDIGDTAMYMPQRDAMVHFKGNVSFAFSGDSELGGIREYACGIKAFGGAEGAWRDAEDGSLSGNAIAQGSVDSVFSIEALVPAGGSERLTTWIVAADNPESAAERIADAGRLAAHSVFRNCVWREEAAELHPELPDDVALLAQRSAAMVRAHCASNGAILAALDSDIMETNRATYAYCWMRDCAHVGATMALAGDEGVAIRFLRFCMSCLRPGRSAFLQKYDVMGALGATWHPWIFEGRPEAPIQEDETASVVSLACEAVRAGLGGQAFRDEITERLIAPCAEFLRSFVSEDGLPLPSYDLWEERRGVHAYTAATVQAAIDAAASLGVTQPLELRLSAFIRDDGTLAPRLDAHGIPVREADASVLAAMLEDVSGRWSREVRERTMTQIQERLTIRSPIGGLARNEGDYYFRRSDDYPGNPWFITTIWMARLQVQMASTIEDLEEALGAMRWCVPFAGTTGVLAEQLHPETGEPLSVSPLTWSHAEYLRLALEWSAKRRQISG